MIIRFVTFFVLLANLSQAGIIRDLESENIIMTLMKPFLNAGGVDEKKWTLYINQDSSVNAYVTTKNRIVINTGVIEQIDDVEIMMAILAHESAHIINNDISKFSAQKNNGAIYALSAAVATLVTGLSPEITGATFGLSTQIYNRESLRSVRIVEHAADQKSFELYEKLGFDPSGILKSHNFFMKKYGFNGGESYTSTHPTSYERIKTTEHWLKNYDDKKHVKIPNSYYELYKRLRAKYIGFFNTIPTIKYVLKNYEKEYIDYAMAFYYQANENYVASNLILYSLVGNKKLNDGYLFEAISYNYERMGKYVSAIEKCEKARELVKSAVIYQQCALLYAKQDINKTLSILENSLKFKKERISTYHVMEKVYLHKKDTKNIYWARMNKVFLIGNIRDAKRYAKLVINKFDKNSKKWHDANRILKVS